MAIRRDGYVAVWLHNYMATWLYGNMAIRLYFHMAIYMCTYGYMPLWQHSWLFGSAATWPYGVTGIKLYAYVCVQGYMARWLCSYMVIWIHGCMAILLHGCMVVWLRGYMHMYDYVATRLNGTWLYTYMTIWLYNYMAQACMRWGRGWGRVKGLWGYGGFGVIPPDIQYVPPLHMYMEFHDAWSHAARCAWGPSWPSGPK